MRLHLNRDRLLSAVPFPNTEAVSVAMMLREIPRVAPTQVQLDNGRAVTVRPITTDDGEALSELYERIAPTPDRTPDRLAENREEAMRRAAFAFDPFSVCLVMVGDDDDIVGYAYYKWRNENSQTGGFGICARNDYREVGAGRVLMDRLLGVARNMGPEYMRLAVPKRNDAAVKLYRRMGFHVVSEGMRPTAETFTAEPHYWMERAVR